MACRALIAAGPPDWMARSTGSRFPARMSYLSGCLPSRVACLYRSWWQSRQRPRPRLVVIGQYSNSVGLRQVGQRARHIRDRGARSRRTDSQGSWATRQVNLWAERSTLYWSLTPWRRKSRPVRRGCSPLSVRTASLCTSSSGASSIVCTLPMRPPVGLQSPALPWTIACWSLDCTGLYDKRTTQVVRSAGAVHNQYSPGSSYLFIQVHGTTTNTHVVRFVVRYI